MKDLERQAGQGASKSLIGSTHMEQIDWPQQERAYIKLVLMVGPSLSGVVFAEVMV